MQCITKSCAWQDAAVTLKQFPHNYYWLFVWEFTGHPWNPFAKVQWFEALVFFKCCKYKHPAKQTIGLLVIWDTVTLMWRRCNNNHITWVQLFPECGPDYYSGDAGVVTSPNFPNNYGNNLNCLYHIVVEPGKVRKKRQVSCPRRSFHDDVIKWKHFTMLLALVYGEFNGEFPAQRPVTQSFDVLFDLHLNKRLSKQSRRRWFAEP